MPLTMQTIGLVMIILGGLAGLKSRMIRSTSGTILGLLAMVAGVAIIKYGPTFLS